MLRRALLSLITILVSCQATAQPRYTLEIQPDKCAVTGQSPICHTELQVNVRGQPAEVLCVSVAQQRQCQPTAADGAARFVFSVQTRANLNVVLSNINNIELSSAPFQIFQFIDKPKRPRRGYLWSSL